MVEIVGKRHSGIVCKAFCIANKIEDIVFQSDDGNIVILRVFKKILRKVCFHNKDY